MYIKLRHIIFVLIILNMTAVGYSRAGQVVTGDAHEWAQTTLKQEQSHEWVKAGNSLAVVNFINKSGEQELDPLQKGMALMLITDLSSIKTLQIVERVKLQALVEELALSSSGLVQHLTAPRIGKMLGARWLVGGDIAGKQLTQIKVDANLLEVATSAVTGRPSAEGKLAELFRIEKDLLFNIVKLIKIDVTPDEETVLRKPCSTNTKALLALFKGTDASDRGDYDTAAELYELSLKEDPNICLSRDAIDELDKLGLIHKTDVNQKKSRALLGTLRDRTSLTNQLTPKEELRNVRTPTDTGTDVNIQVTFPPTNR